MAITPTQFAKKTAQCKFLPPRSCLSASLTSSHSGQLGGCEASGAFLLPRMDPSCTYNLAVPVNRSVFKVVVDQNFTWKQFLRGPEPAKTAMTATECPADKTQNLGPRDADHVQHAHADFSYPNACPPGI